jgi:hypothetical protein
MRLDHLSYAAGPEGVEATADRLGLQLGAVFKDGGFHPRFGTVNRILPLAGGRYLEVVAVLDHPSADKAPFGQAVRARSAAGGGWLGWVVAVDDLALLRQRIGRTPAEGLRHLPSGRVLEWLQLGVLDLQNDPQLPFFVQWISGPTMHPSIGGGSVELASIEIAAGRVAGRQGRRGARRCRRRVERPGRDSWSGRSELPYAQGRRARLRPRDL